MTIRRRRLLTGFAAMVTVAPPARAVQSIRPKRPLTLLLGFPRGTPADRTARDFVKYLAPYLPANDIAPTNLPGDAGRAMLAALGDAPPNGMTIGWVTTPTLPARMIDRGELSLGKRILLLGQIEREPIAFFSLASEPANSIQDIIRRASDDGDAVPLGTPPAGSPPHLAALRLQVLAQTQLNIITFPSSEAARQAVLDGNVSAAALGLSAAIGDLRDGALSAVGIAAGRRFGPPPDASALDEGGIALSAFITRGIGVPAGTPPYAVASLVNAIRTVAQAGPFAEQAEESGYYAAWAEGADWLAQMRAEQAVLAKLWETNPWLSSPGG